MRHDDADEIRRRLENRLEELLSSFYPGWVQRGGKGFLTPKSPKNLGSFQVNLKGSRRGQWYRFSQQVGGGTVELISYALTNGTKAYEQAFREARAFLGMSREESRRDDPEIRARREREAEESARRRERQEQLEERKKARRAETAIEVWAECRPISDTLAERYLSGRGIPAPPDGWPDVLGFHVGLEWEQGAEWADGRKVKEGPVFPCLVGRVQDAGGETTAVWRIYLSESGEKAPIEPNKVGLGPANGGAIRIGGVGPKIGVAEGVETALGAWWLIGRRFPVWSVMSTSGMANFEPPLAVERGTTFPDGDHPSQKRGEEYVAAEPPGRRAARILRDRMTSVGLQWTTEAEPPIKQDYLDLWRDRQTLENA